MTPGSGRTILGVNLLLMVLGAVVGVLAAIPLTWIGKFITGAPDPATAANYFWNMRAFGIMGAVFGLVLAWSALRRVPLWRAALEPAAGAVIGGSLGMMLGSGGFFLLLAGCGVSLAAWRVNHAYRDRALLRATDTSVAGSLQP